MAQRHARCDANHDVASHIWIEMENAVAMLFEGGVRKLKGDVDFFIKFYVERNN